MSEIDSQIPANENEANELLASIEGGVSDESSQETQQAEAAQKQAIAEYAFTHGGREVKAPIDKILKWASQGYDAPNKIGELNKKLEGYTTKEAQFKEWESKYGDVDKYVRENPQWWDFVRSQYDQQAQMKQASQGLNPELINKFQELETTVKDLAEYKNNIVMQQEDQKYMKEFETVTKKYSKVDFATPDPETGKNLEYKVIEFAQANGIRNFETAFKAFHHDELIKMAEESAKEKLISDKQSKSKLGILGISSTPTKRPTDSVKGKSYNDIEREINEAYGLT